MEKSQKKKKNRSRTLTEKVLEPKKKKKEGRLNPNRVKQHSRYAVLYISE
jgi:hypothetical protein